MIDHSKPWTAHCTAPQFAKKPGQRILAKDGSVIVVAHVTPPRRIVDQDRYRYTYLTREATAAEIAESLAANAAAAARAQAAIRSDDERHD